ncbi:hypothetical protein [Phaeocystidibacter luteus]|uniref:Lipoprotein n=1 Tax=Phaeocystidibacter luteus TaxID=911197 RepID=A0A6N6RGS9_9FLAO|nr:hypothetical protein [Phaeocystidibacter luteus]KAB2809953.1 hypothetical protein F8C67_08720 [Phaeocystidibacter luteus]
MRILLLTAVFALTACGTYTGLSKETETVIATRFCECMESSLPELDEYSMQSFEYAATHEEELWEEFHQNMLLALRGEDSATYLKNMTELFDEFDMDEYIEACGETLLEQYPILDSLEDQQLVDLFKYRMPKDCRFTRAIIEAYEYHEM